jgi:hypothetical protein
MAAATITFLLSQPLWVQPQDIRLSKVFFPRTIIASFIGKAFSQEGKIRDRKDMPC